MSSGGNPEGHRARQPNAIERRALDWLAARDRGLSPAETEKLERWLAEDARHARAFADFDDTWSLLNRIEEIPPGAMGAPASFAGTDESAGARQSRNQPVRRWFVPVSLAAAAVLVIAPLFWWMANVRSAGSDFAERFATEVGGLRHIKLPDGSLVQLNTDSALGVHFSPTERRVRLDRGEAHFAVARNPARPFIVSAAGIDVQAVGTAFNVRLRTEAVEVLVTAGRVRVDAESEADRAERNRVGPAAQTANAPTLAPGSEISVGQKLVVNRRMESAAADHVRIAPVPPVEIERTLAWQERRLEFVDVLLAEIVAEFNRYHRHQLVLADPELAAQRFGGTFRADDPASFVRVLAANFGVAVEQSDHETILRIARR